jgi:hypothetical protein
MHRQHTGSALEAGWTASGLGREINIEPNLPGPVNPVDTIRESR